MFVLGVNESIKNGKIELLSRNTIESHKTNLRAIIQQASGGDIDINKRGLFVKFWKVYHGLKKEIKEAGKSETHHHPVIESREFSKILL